VNRFVLVSFARNHFHELTIASGINTAAAQIPEMAMSGHRT
jgi:hypothetical protein